MSEGNVIRFRPGGAVPRRALSPGRWDTMGDSPVADLRRYEYARKSIHTSEPSFFYLMMAESCFRRAVTTRFPKAGGMLREIGRNYLAKAAGVRARRIKA